MQIVSVVEMEAPKKRPRKQVDVQPLDLKKSKVLDLPPKAVEPVVKQPAPEPVPGPRPAMRIPLPATAGFSEDERFRGVTTAMDKVLDAVHRDGWSLMRLYEQPLATLPLPPGKFPPGRSYLFSESVAVVVNSHTGSIITSLPATAALKTLHQFTPDVLESDPWASARWAEFLGDASFDDIDTNPRWYKQSFFDKAGSIWTVRRVHDGVKIYRDGELLHLVQDDVEAEDLNLHPVIVELVAFVLEIEQDS